MFYISLTPTATDTFPTTPWFSFHLGFGVAPLPLAAPAYLAIYDPTQPTLGWQTLGVSPIGLIVDGIGAGTYFGFSGVASPITFAANQTYLFVAFQTTAAIVVPSAFPT